MEQAFRMKVTKLKIADKAIGLIKSRETKMQMALALGVSERWISKCVKVNKSNGFLTRASSLQFIKKATGLRESEILENVQTTEPQVAAS